MKGQDGEQYCQCKPSDFPHGRLERFLTNHPVCVRCRRKVSPEELDRHRIEEWGQ